MDTWEESGTIRKLTHGGETEVWLVEEGSQITNIEYTRAVVKNMVYALMPSGLNTCANTEWGLTIEAKFHLESQYKRAKNQYGDLIPNQTFIQNPDHPERWIIVQEYVEIETPPSPFERCPSNYNGANPNLGKETDTLIKELKRQFYILWHHKEGEDTAIVLDLEGQENLVLTKDHKLRYIDSNFVNKYVADNFDSAEYVCNTSQYLMLELLGGATTVQEVSNDPMYQFIFHKYQLLDQIADLVDLSDRNPREARDSFFEMIKSKIFKPHLDCKLDHTVTPELKRFISNP